MFHIQSWWKPWVRLVIVAVCGFGLIFSLTFSWSFYGILILGRMIFQLILAGQNNLEIQQLVRKKIIDAVEKKEATTFSRQQISQLTRLHDYREFRQKLQTLFPHLQNQAIWTGIIWQVFFDLGFAALDLFPPVYVEIPLYRPESLREVQQTLTSLRNQTYPGIQEIVLLFNDPGNIKMKKVIQAEIHHIQADDHRVHFVSLNIASKRTAMHVGFQRHIQEFTVAFSEWLGFLPTLNQWNPSLQKLIKTSYQQRTTFDPRLNAISVNIDADTLVDPDAIALGVMLLLLDPATSAITSNVEIRNHNLNFLARLTFARYKAANVTERAAQSRLKNVRCMSGPFMLFWTRNLLSISPRGCNIAEEWVNERFLQVKVEPGDDRSLTVRHNEQGLGVRFQPDIYVTTDCPISWERWCKQQLRWMRSSNRNFLMSLPFLFKLPLYIIFDDLYLFCFPFLLMVIMAKLGFQFVSLLVHHSFWNAYLLVLPYICIVFALHLFKSVHLAVTQKNIKLLWLSLYFFIYLRYLIFLRILSVVTITHSEWTGRTSADFLADQAILKGDST